MLSLLLQDVCKIVVNYCHILKQRVRLLSENSDHGSAINMVSAGKQKRLHERYFYIKHISNLSPLPVVVRGGERPGALAVSAHPTSYTAELDRASRPDPKRHRGKPVQQHSALPASASSECPWPRDPLRFRHSWEKGVAFNM